MPDTLTLSTSIRKAVLISTGGTPPIGLFMGQVNLSNYQQTKSPWTQITGQFDTAAVPVVVQPDAVSSGGYHLRWDTAAQAMRAYTGATGVDVEAANGVNVGTFGFVAFGKVPR